MSRKPIHHFPEQAEYMPVFEPMTRRASEKMPWREGLFKPHLKTLTRKVGAHDLAPLTTFATDALKATQARRISGAKIPTLALTLASNRLINQIYQDCYLNVVPNPQSAFNRNVHNFKDAANWDQPSMSVMLGKAAVFGAKYDPNAYKFVGVEVHPEMIDGTDMMQERDDFLTWVLDGRGDMLRVNVNPDRKMHISLTKTYSYDDAGLIADQLNETGEVNGRWLTLEGVQTEPVPYKPNDL